jgi:hypothetical protein
MAAAGFGEVGDACEKEAFISPGISSFLKLAGARLLA